MNWALFKGFDQMRRAQGAMLDGLGLRPRETPYQVVYREPGLALRSYGGRRGAPVLIVPAPIKRSYIWDLEAQVSAVRRCLEADAAVYLADWQPAPADLGLADYAGRLLRVCLREMGGEPAFLLGHSLGGLFAAIFAALHPQQVRGVALLASPLAFGRNAPVFGRLVGNLESSQLPASLPGTLLSTASYAAAPRAFGSERWTDGAASLLNPAHLRSHMLVERWSLEESPLPRQLVADLIDDIVREDRFARGSLTLEGRTAAPSGLTAPLLCVIDEHCAMVPPESILPVFRAAGGGDKTLLHYEQEPGVALQHVGPLVGRRAHRTLWPAIIRWMQAH